MKRYAQYDLENMSVEEKEELARTTKNPEILRELAKDESYWVRKRVAENPNTPPDVLRELVEDEEIFVSFEVARNPNTPVDVLRELAEHEDYRCRTIVLKNPNVTDDIIDTILDRKVGTDGLVALLENFDKEELRPFLDRIYDRFVENFNTEEVTDTYLNDFVYMMPREDLVNVYQRLENPVERGLLSIYIFEREDATELPDDFIEQVFLDSLEAIGLNDLPYILFDDPYIKPEIVRKLVEIYISNDLHVPDVDKAIKSYAYDIYEELKGRDIEINSSRKRYYSFRRFSDGLGR